MDNVTRLYELTKMIDNHNLINDDINNALSSVRSTLNDRYLTKIRQAVEEEQVNSKNHPSREIILLRALKNFMPQDNRHTIDNAITMLNAVKTMSSVQNTLGQISAQNKTIEMSSSGEASPNGAVSESSLKMTGLIMALALFGKI